MITDLQDPALNVASRVLMDDGILELADPNGLIVEYHQDFRVRCGGIFKGRKQNMDYELRGRLQ